jgi:hypothetical protein
MNVPYTPVPIPQQMVYLKNPTPKLIKALGKTDKDLVSDDFGQDWKWLEIPNLPDGVEVRYGIENTYLLGEYNKPSVVRKKTVKPKVVAKISVKKKVAKKMVVISKNKTNVLNGEESTRLAEFKKQELRMRFSTRITKHFERLRSVQSVILDELARTKSKGLQRPIIDRGKHLKMIFADLSPLEVQEFAEISLYVFHDCEVDAVIPMKHLSPRAHLATA